MPRRERGHPVASAEVRLGDVVRVHVRRRLRQAPHAGVGAIGGGDARRQTAASAGRQGARRERGAGEDARDRPSVLQVPRAAENRGEALRARSRGGGGVARRDARGTRA